MDGKSMTRRALVLLLALCALLSLSGCRARTTGGLPDAAISPAASGAGDGQEQGEELPGAAPAGAPLEGGDPDAGEPDEAGSRTRDDSSAVRKEYDENAPAEVLPGTDRPLHGEGDGDGAPISAAEDAPDAASQLADQAEDTATQTVPAGEAEEMGVSEDADQADSAMTYYTVLLHDRSGSLYECQRANVYWETAEDHVTVHKSSMEHALILAAGAYDVSARLLPENLRVDDGWVVRKNPQVIVKIVGGSLLGGGVFSTGAAQAFWQALCSRDGWAAVEAVREGRVLLLSQELLDAPYLQTAAMLMIAKMANPDLYADVDVDEALRMLAEEATGAPPAGVFRYSGSEG